MNRTNKKKDVQTEHTNIKTCGKNKQKWRCMNRAYKHKDGCTEERSNQIDRNNKENAFLISTAQENTTISCEYSSELRTQFVFVLL